MKNPILYVIVNKDLKMSPGKAAAQAVHAAMTLKNTHRDAFTEPYKRTVIVLEASGREQLDGIADYLSNTDLDYEHYVDEGKNEVEAFALTALAVEPIDEADEEKRAIFEALPLFSGRYDKDEDEERATSYFQEAASAIRMALPFKDDRPWFVRMTVKWLEKR